MTEMSFVSAEWLQALVQVSGCADRPENYPVKTGNPIHVAHLNSAHLE